MNEYRAHTLIDLISSSWVRYGFLVVFIISGTLGFAHIESSLSILRADALESRDARKEYIPRIIELEKQNAIAAERYKEILRRLENIDKKLQ